MKRIFKIYLIALSMVCISCSKDDATVIPQAVVPNVTSGAMKAKFNDQSWVATNLEYVKISRFTKSNKQRFDIKAQDSKQIITLSCEEALRSDKSVGIKTFTGTDISGDEFSGLGDALFANSYVTSYGSMGFHFMKSGTLTVTSIDLVNKTISGTFSFTTVRDDDGEDTDPSSPIEFKATEGVFTNLKYVVTDYDL